MSRGGSWRNWSGSVRCTPNFISAPLSVEEVQSEVLRCAEEGERVRVVGSGYSFSPLCWSDENLMSLANYRGVEWLDADRQRVWARAGTRLDELAAHLGENGLALPVTSDSGAETVAGAICTGTHGSGVALQGLSSHVTGLKLVCADGSVRTIWAEENAELLDAARLSLGALGVITHVELQCVAAHRVRLRTIKAPLARVLRDLDDHARSHHGFRFEWLPGTGGARLFFADVTQEPARRRQPHARVREFVTEDAAPWLLAEVSRRLPAIGARASRLSARVAGSADRVQDSAQRRASRLRLHRYDETEFAVPVAALPDVVDQLDRVIRALRFTLHLPLAVHFSRSDDLWLSPACGRDTAFVSLRLDAGKPHAECLAAAIGIFDRHDGRPHWGKLHDKTAAAFAAMYPRWADFLAVRAQLDPRGVFLNPHLCAVLGVAAR